GRDPRAVGRKRRRKVHADERAVRPVPAGGGRHQKRRPGGADQGPERCKRTGDRHGPPALQAGGMLFHFRQHHPGRGTLQERLPAEA
ncbi:HTH-type transcriptional regulator PuuR, partial [Dysosmobacter welbionis]